MYNIHKIFYLIASLFLFACSKSWQLTWYKEGATTQQRDEVIYDCLQKSQQSYKRGKLIMPSVSTMVTNEELFTYCMKANGFFVTKNKKPLQ